MRNYKVACKLKRFVDSEIKTGDKVRIVDGSALCLKDIQDIDIYIVLPYPLIFNSNKTVKELEFTVTVTDIQYIATEGVARLTIYSLDCLIEYNGVQLYNCSQFLEKI